MSDQNHGASSLPQGGRLQVIVTTRWGCSRKGGTFTCLDCGHRGWRLTIRSRCPMCGRKATYGNTV